MSLANLTNKFGMKQPRKREQNDDTLCQAATRQSRLRLVATLSTHTIKRTHQYNNRVVRTRDEAVVGLTALLVRQCGAAQRAHLVAVGRSLHSHRCAHASPFDDDQTVRHTVLCSTSDSRTATNDDKAVVAAMRAAHVEAPRATARAKRAHNAAPRRRRRHEACRSVVALTGAVDANARLAAIAEPNLPSTTRQRLLLVDGIAIESTRRRSHRKCRAVAAVQQQPHELIAQAAAAVDDDDR
jgi:hypothetical protein